MTESALEYALRVASDEERRWHVFPLQKDSKIPPPGLKWQRVSTNSIEEIKKLASKYPDCNWALDCEKSGICAIDLDHKTDKDGSMSLFRWEMENEELPKTVIHGTPHNGDHILLKMNGFKVKSVVNKGSNGGIDIRASGGYIGLPGSKVYDIVIDKTLYYSIKNDGPIAELPESFAKWIGKPKVKDAEAEIPACELDIETNIERAKEYLKNATPSIEGDGGNSNAFKVACRVRDFGVEELTCLELMDDHWNDRCEPPWDIKELERIVVNAYEYASEKAGNSAPEADFEPIPDPVSKKPKSKFGPFRTFKEHVALKFPPPITYLSPWITSETNYLVYSEPGVGKSFFAMQIAISIATGKDFGTCKSVNKAATAYVDAEMTGNMLNDRIKGFFPEGEEIPDNLFAISNSDAVQNGFDVPNLNNPEWRKWLLDGLLEKKVKFCVLDNLSSLCPGTDENSKQDFDPINEFLIEAKNSGVSMMVLHHANKSGSQRGSSAKTGQMDYVIELKKDDSYDMARDGAKFKLVFEKKRIEPSKLVGVAGITYTLQGSSEFGYFWEIGKMGDDKLEAVLSLIEAGHKKQTVMAEMLDVSVSTVKRCIEKAKNQRYIKGDKKGGFSLTAKGRRYLYGDGDG